VIDGNSDGYVVYKIASSPGDGSYSFTGENMLALNNTGIGVYVSNDIQTWSIDYVNSYSNGTNYSPASSKYTNQKSVDAKLGSCKVWIPDSSPMKKAGKNGADIGANILYRYERGILTNKPLWDPATGAFPCGAIIAGVNDITNSSCFDVHNRLNVNVNGCAFPADYNNHAPSSPTNLRIIAN
jgi:hypothetical protein